MRSAVNPSTFPIDVRRGLSQDRIHPFPSGPRHLVMESPSWVPLWAASRREPPWVQAIDSVGHAAAWADLVHPVTLRTLGWDRS